MKKILINIFGKKKQKEIKSVSEFVNELDYQIINPMLSNRFIIEFPGIQSWVFNSYKGFGENYSELKIILLNSVNQEKDIFETLSEIKKNKRIGDVKISILDATGKVTTTITLPACKVSEVKMFTKLSYEDSDVLYADICLDHKYRVIR